MSQYHTINTGEVERSFTLRNRLNWGDRITSGTVNYYLLARSGPNAGKWWRDSDQTWQAVATGNAMAHVANGAWLITLAASPFAAGGRYLEYAAESNGYDVPCNRLLVCDAAPGTAGGAPTLDNSAKLLVYSVSQGVTVATNSDKTGYALAADQAVNVTKWGGIAVASAMVQANAAQIGGQTAVAATPVSFPASLGTSTFDPTLHNVKATDTSGIALATHADVVDLPGVKAKTDLIATNAADSPNAVVAQVAVGQIKTKTDNLPADPAAVTDIPTAVQTADAVLSRNVAACETTSPRTSLATLVLAATNKANTQDHAGYLTVYRTDGVSEHVRLPITVDANAAPIEGVG